MQPVLSIRDSFDYKYKIISSTLHREDFIELIDCDPNPYLFVKNICEKDKKYLEYFKNLELLTISNKCL